MHETGGGAALSAVIGFLFLASSSVSVAIFCVVFVLCVVVGASLHARGKE